MKTIGFVISNKNNEKRRAIIPNDLIHICNKDFLYFEKGYGDDLFISDSEYSNLGCHVVSRKEVLNCDIIVDVKLGDADYLEQISDDKILFGWAHAVQNIDFTTKCLKKKHTVIAWEELYDNDSYLFYRNREIAGEAAIIQAIRYSGKMPYDCKIAILGNGKTSKGAQKVLNGLNASIDIYDYYQEKEFKSKMQDYDIIVNCILWDTNRTDHIIYKEDLKKLMPGTLLVDVACDPHQGIETSQPTTIDNPVYTIDNIIHYAVDNTPAMFPITVTKSISRALAPLIDLLVTDNNEEIIENATVIKHGIILDDRIKSFRKNQNIVDNY